jgi:hypothetical protein
VWVKKVPQLRTAAAPSRSRKHREVDQSQGAAKELMPRGSQKTVLTQGTRATAARSRAPSACAPADRRVSSGPRLSARRSSPGIGTRSAAARHNEDVALDAVASSQRTRGTRVVAAAEAERDRLRHYIEMAIDIIFCDANSISRLAIIVLRAKCRKRLACRRRCRWVPDPPGSPVTRDPPGGARAVLRLHREVVWREGGVVLARHLS